MRRAALGRGLDALIPASSEAQRARELPLDAIEPNPQQPRKSFGADQSAELAQSIREHGILQPLLVRQLSGGRYQLVAGERRWRAAELASLERVPVVVVDVPDRDMLTLALVENLQREDLNPIDQAVAFQYLIDAGLTQAQVAARIGKSRSVGSQLGAAVAAARRPSGGCGGGSVGRGSRAGAAWRAGGAASAARRRRNGAAADGARDRAGGAAATGLDFG